MEGTFTVRRATRRGGTLANREEHDRPGFEVVAPAGDATDWFGSDVDGEAVALERATARAAELASRPVVACKVCGGTVQAKDPVAFPYCRSCFYAGRAETRIRAAQVERFRAAFPGCEPAVDHTGGGCFWFAVYFPGDDRFYVLTDGEASLPVQPEEDEPAAEVDTFWRSPVPVANGGWGYVGRHSSNEDDGDEYDMGHQLVYRSEAVGDPSAGLSDEEAIEVIRADRVARGLETTEHATGGN